MIRFRRDRRVTPPMLTTAAVPDLIFTVLFFFMLVTHMRDYEVKVAVDVPESAQQQRPARKTATAHVYIGVGAGRERSFDGDVCIQFEGRLLTVDALAQAVTDRVQSLSDDDRPLFTVVVSADRHAPMSLVGSVRQELRRAGVRRVVYQADGIANVPVRRRDTNRFIYKIGRKNSKSVAISNYKPYFCRQTIRLWHITV